MSLAEPVDHDRPLAAIPGEPDIVRAETEVLAARAEDLRSVGSELEQVRAALVGMTGTPIAAAAARLDGLWGRVSRLGMVLDEAVPGLRSYAGVLETTQPEVAAACAADEEAHADYSRWRQEFSDLHYEAGNALARLDVAEANRLADEGREVRRHLEAAARREQDAHRRWTTATEEHATAASAARSALGVVVQGPSAVGAPSPHVAGGNPAAQAAGQLAVEHMDRIALDHLTDAELAAELARIEALRAQFGDDPAFFAGMLSTPDDVDAFLDFLTRAAASGGGPLADSGREFAHGARQALPEWSAMLPPHLQYELGRQVVWAAGGKRATDRGALAAYVLGGGSLPSSLWLGAAEELDRQLRVPGATFEPDGGFERVRAFLAGGEGSAGADGGANAPEPALRTFDLRAVATDGLGANPGAALAFFAPVDRETAAGRVAFWFDGQANRTELTGVLDDGGTALFTALAAAVQEGSTGAAGQQERAALLMLDVTHQLGDEKTSLMEVGLGGDALRAMAAAYSPYVDGMGASLGDWERTEVRGAEPKFAVGNDGLYEQFHQGGVLGAAVVPMPAFDQTELQYLLRASSWKEEGQAAWENVLLGHMYDAGVFSAELESDVDRESLVSATSERAANVWGTLDAARVSDAAAHDSFVAASAANVATLLLAGLGPGSRAGAGAAGVGANEALGAILPSASVEAETLAEIRADYSSRSAALAEAFYRGGVDAGLAGGRDIDSFYRELASTSAQQGETSSEKTSNDALDRMVAMRDAQTR